MFITDFTYFIFEVYLTYELKNDSIYEDNIPAKQ